MGRASRPATSPPPAVRATRGGGPGGACRAGRFVFYAGRLFQTAEFSSMRRLVLTASAVLAVLALTAPVRADRRQGYDLS